ncbi:unnamed protein product [Kluyveromyces dobzhanskii CBS 2104]|uniref:Calcium-transporting ATPase n=1 Tax=Kluyveromyces dobzhanskii CBS 2104 TaxID=1427455 RepID=A0A0A8L6A0_9SACH|nr:unnamed protein product [Kluyveromyces dobzhanskii CBS 2104]
MSDNPFESYLAREQQAPQTATADVLSQPNASLEFCTVSVENTLSQLGTDIDNGLSNPSEIAYRKSIWGSNEVLPDEKESLWKKFLCTFVEDPLILLLIGSAVISFLMGNIDDSISIALAIIIVVTVGFVQEYKSEKSLEALNKLVPAACHLTRSGQLSHVLASNLVPGDLVRFKVGDRIPADLRIVESVDLCIDESNLTGENEPVHKSAAAVDAKIYSHIPGSIIPVGDRNCIGFMGTLVREGHGKGVVIATGKHTVFGSVFEMMSNIDKPKTPLQVAMDKLGKDLSYMSFILIGLICVVGIIQGRSWLEMFQIAVSLAVAAIPEGLPIIVTVTLALGVLRMAKRKAIVRRLPSVETLGSVNVICSDKTGTLTANHMTVSKIWCLGSMENKTNFLTLSKLKERPIPIEQDVAATLKIGNICNNATYSSEHLKYLGNPTDVAILESLKQFGLEDCRNSVNNLSEISFNSRRKLMAVKTINANDKIVVYVKGAFEKILEKSSHYLGKDGKVHKLKPNDMSTISDSAIALASEGLRTLAFAELELTTANSEKDFDETMIAGLTFTGLIAMNDPPRPAVRSAIEELIQGSVHVIMITGDAANTAVSIARQIGIPVVNPEYSVLTGDKLDQMTDSQLASVIDHVNVFARATPEHKLNIVRALQKRGDIVAMTGDGVNDAPALKLADIGVSMGKMGTDVAKEASDMVLTDDDFSTILTAIEEGKVAISTALKLPNPLNAMQILWINILMDGPPAQSLGVEPVDHEVMKKPPRKRSDKILTDAVLKRVLISACFIICGTIYVFVKEMAEDGQVTSRDTTMTFTCFVFFDMFNALACRHCTKSIFEIGFFANKMFNYAVSLSLLGQICAIYIPFFQSIFKTESLSLGDLAFLLTISSSVFIGDEIRKYYAKKNRYSESHGSSIV